VMVVVVLTPGPGVIGRSAPRRFARRDIAQLPAACRAHRAR
jgi:hypothetical protein